MAITKYIINRKRKIFALKLCTKSAQLFVIFSHTYTSSDTISTDYCKRFKKGHEPKRIRTSALQKMMKAIRISIQRHRREVKNCLKNFIDITNRHKVLQK